MKKTALKSSPSARRRRPTASPSPSSARAPTHEVWEMNGTNVIIPRHTEINEMTAKAIIRTAIEEAEK